MKVTSEDSHGRLTNANPWIEKEILLADMKVIKWMQKYILGKDWTPWERQEDKKDEKKEEKK